MTNTQAAVLSVPCPAPKCRALRGEPCRRSYKTHTARTSKALSTAMRDDYRAHERIWKALHRVRGAAKAGRAPAAADVTTALGSCGCGECQAAIVPLAQELQPWL